MENIIPLNGRIAIIDDRPNEALPLMRVLSSNNIPYVYIKGGDPEYYPLQPENDIRVLFLDINLLGSQAVPDTQFKGILIQTLQRVISPSNYPYILVYWSKQDPKYDELIKSIYNDDLKDRKPIAIKSLSKSDFFPNDDEEEHPNDYDIIKELKEIIKSIPAYNYLMQWENIAHFSTDELVKTIFPNTKPEEWENVTNFIINSLSKAFLGQYFSMSSTNEEDIIKAGLSTLNMVYIDSIDNNLNRSSIFDPQELSFNILDTQRIERLNSELNQKLLLSSNPINISEPGVVVQYENPKKDYFEMFLHKVLSIFSIKQEVLSKKPDILDSVLRSEIKENLKQIKQDIKQTWKQIGIVVTPSCDFAQNKKIYDRIVQGILIESRFVNYINQGDAFYTSPSFYHDGKNYIIVINFNFFITSILDKEADCKILFKIRRQLLAEIQSKLSRHINRQGILNL